IAEIIAAGGFSIDKRQVILDSPIKTLGIHAARIALHPEVAVSVSFNVARSEDEAERPARGEDISVMPQEKIGRRTFSEDAMFEEGARNRSDAEAQEQQQSSTTNR